MNDKKLNGSVLFDNWAKDYDKDVDGSNEANVYPFAGYDLIKKGIIHIVNTTQSVKILEMGIGTGTITQDLYQSKMDITGIDISIKMIEIAREKMPLATFYHASFFDSLKIINNQQFDCIIFSYSIHHLKYDDQVNLLRLLLKNLNEKGTIIIGDVMTSDLSEMDSLSTIYKASWDSEERYPIYNMYCDQLGTIYNINLRIVSHCSGYMVLTKL